MIKFDLIQISTIYSFLCYFNYCSVSPFLLNMVPVLRNKSRKKNASCTDLVVWGSNLASTVGIGKFTKQTREMIKLPPYQKSVIIGLILSDGFLSLSSKGSKNARLEFEQSKEYVFFVFFILSHYCNSLPVLKKGIRKENVNYSLKIVTRSILCFTELYSLFYLNKVKIIPDNIYDLLTPVALAHFIMGDGQVASNGLRICTDAYSSSDIVKLINVLMIKYRLVCTIHVLDDRQRIYISAKSINLLAPIIKPYMIKSMYYKIKS